MTKIETQEEKVFNSGHLEVIVRKIKMGYDSVYCGVLTDKETGLIEGTLSVYDDLEKWFSGFNFVARKLFAQAGTWKREMRKANKKKPSSEFLNVFGRPIIRTINPNQYSLTWDYDLMEEVLVYEKRPSTLKPE
jgi:hypothetical protein